MDFHKIPRSTILHLYLGRLFAPDGRTDGRRANFLERYDFDNHPFGVDYTETRNQLYTETRSHLYTSLLITNYL